MLFSKKRLQDLMPSVSYNDLKKRVRIIVIDDDPNSFPISILKDEGYSIDYWEEVKTLSKLEEGFYDIIILDIMGVAKKYSPDEDGIGILKHLKKVNPAQVVIAFSGHSFDLSKSVFWKLADDTLAKPVNALECKDAIDELIKKFITPQYFWSGISQILKREGIHDKQIKKIEYQLVDAIKKKDNSHLQQVIKTTVANTDLATRIISIALKIASWF